MDMFRLIHCVIVRIYKKSHIQGEFFLSCETKTLEKRTTDSNDLKFHRYALPKDEKF